MPGKTAWEMASPIMDIRLSTKNTPRTPQFAATKVPVRMIQKSFMARVFVGVTHPGNGRAVWVDLRVSEFGDQGGLQLRRNDVLDGFRIVVHVVGREVEPFVEVQFPQAVETHHARGFSKAFGCER